MIKERYSGSRRYPFSSKSLFDLFLFSSFIFVLASLFIRYILTYLESVMFNFFDIIYVYTPFSNYFTYTDSGNWNLNKLVVVFGLLPALMFASGFLLLLIKTRNWKTNLFITWLAFLLCSSLPVSMLTGSFIYDGFGIAYHWVLQYFILRIGLAVFAVGIMMWFRPFWIQRFLRCTYTRELTSEESKRNKFLLYTIYLPWYAGTLACIPFAFSGHSWYWIVSLAFTGIIVLPVFRLETQFEDVTYQTGKAIFLVRFPLVFVLTVIGVLWVISWYHIGM